MSLSSTSSSTTPTSPWSTSWGAAPPLLFTSAKCLEAMRELIQNPTLLSIATEASSHPSGLSSLFEQPWLYAGGGLGNIDECTDFMTSSASARLHVCLAGGVGKTAQQDTIPAFASVCLPQACNALDLAAPDFPATLLQLLDQINNNDDPRNTNNNIFYNNIENRELAREFIRLQQRIYDLNEFLQTGWSCGEYQVPFQSFPFGIPYLFLLTTMIILTVLGTAVLRKPSRCSTSSVMSLSNHGNGEEAKDEHDVPATPHHSQHPRIDQQEMLPLMTNNNAQTYNDHNHQNHSTQNHAPSSTSVSTQPAGSFWFAWNARIHWNTIFSTTVIDETKHRQQQSNGNYNYNYNTACLDGLRVGSMLWIVLGHVMAIQSSRGGGYLNPRDFMPPTGFTTTWLGQLLFASRFAVDTFFCISGYLVVHVLWTKRDRIVPTNLRTTTSISHNQNYAHRNHGHHQNSDNDNHQATMATNGTRSSSHDFSSSSTFWTRIFPGLMLHRLLRILPLYVMCLGFWTQVAPHLGTKTILAATSGGPFWYQWQSLLQPCQDYGWTNVIFLNNFIPPNVPTTQTCFYHSWYIAVDLQLFLFLGPPLVYCYIKWGRRWGLALTMGLMLVSLLVTMYLSFVRQWSINTFDGAAVARFDVEGYAKPYVRAQSYLAGMFLAMALLSPSSLPQQSIVSTTWKHHLLMTTALLTLILVTFGTVTGAYARRPCQYHEWPEVNQCGSTWSAALTFWYAATSRLLWSLATTAIMGLCLSGHGGWVNAILSLPQWKVLSHLTYGVYLIHPMVIFVWQLGSREKEVFRLATVGMNYVAVVVTSFLLALAAAVVIEYPCATLSRRYLRMHDTTTTASTEAAAMTSPSLSPNRQTAIKQLGLNQAISTSMSSFSLNGFHHKTLDADDENDSDDATPIIIRRTVQHDYYGSLSISFSETSPDDSLTSGGR